MVTFEQGNLLDANVDALVNTVNTVGVMGKGIALMFKERFPENFKAYAAACKRGDVRLGEMFVTENIELGGPQWIVNFPTKDHWRTKTRLEWIEQGMEDLARVIATHGIRSIAVPPLGCGNGGLSWGVVRPVIESMLACIEGLDATVYEPTARYQNVAKKRGVEELTPARALVAEMVRRYSVLGLGCSVLEVQKLAWFIARGVEQTGVEDPLKLEFHANVYGPYSDKLRLLLDALDGSYLRCERRLADAKPSSEIWFNRGRKELCRCLHAVPREAIPASTRVGNQHDSRVRIATRDGGLVYCRLVAPTAWSYGEGGRCVGRYQALGSRPPAEGADFR